MLGQGLFRCSNILETKEHLALFFINGDLNIVDYSYTNQEKLNEKSIDFHRYRMPYYYQFYDIANRYPAQVILNNTWITENALDFHIKHPMNKFNRLEFFSGIRNRSFSVFGYDVDDLNEDLFSPDFGFTNQDIQFYRFLRNSSGSNVFLGMAYVRDTVLYSNKTWGPFHGNAFRAQLEFAPSLGEEFQGYTSINVIARTYRHLGSSSLFAAQAKLLKTTRENGDFMLLCGPEMLRGCEYGSIIGNKIGYASAELRFPLPGTYVLYQNIRGLLFVDSAYASFSNDNFSANKKNTFGFGLHYFIPFLGLPAQSIWIRDNGKWKPSFYITFHW
jgi:outer membrane protein assembly factor BamA